MGGYIHWHEGLFMQPHHLQELQRQTHERITEERRLNRPYPYGVADMQLAADALENMTVQFDQLKAILPGGLYVALGENADIPALDIKSAFSSATEPLTVSLGVPRRHAGRANVLSEEQAGNRQVNCRYSTAAIEMRDENTGDNPQTVLVRRINARLLLDTDDRADLEILPLLRIARAAGDQVGLPRLDADFLPPCLVLGGSPALRQMARDLANQVNASRKELILQMKRGGFRVENMRGIHFEQVLRLRTLNRFGPRLHLLSQAPGTTPLELFLTWSDLLGELAALYPGEASDGDPEYDHDRPGPAFAALARRIRRFLRGSVKPGFLQVEFAPQAGVLVADLTDEHLTLPNEYYLGIRSGMEPQKLMALAEDGNRFKVMAHSMIQRAIWGMRLQAERVPPLELPAQTGLHFFRFKLDESARMWEAIGEEKKIAIKWPDMENEDCRIALYMTVPHGEVSP
jgi:type VI secretion system protein ImpJ